LKRYEKESLLKSFSLFFSTLLLLNIIIFSLHYHDQEEELQNEIFNKIKLYNYTFEDKDITIDVVPLKNIHELFSLKIEKDEIFAYFDIPNSKQNSLKVIYDFTKYKLELKKVFKQNILYFFLSSIVLFLLSIIYSLYALKPLKEALYLLETFLKDIIHDLNTPLSSILLNLKILHKKTSFEALNRIEYSALSIGSLYKNLESSINQSNFEITTVNIKELIDQKIEYFSYLYPDTTFELDIQTDTIQTSNDAISRILENLISNACKYAHKNPKISLHVKDKTIIIKDNGIGIRDTKKVFERFYKENERGLGLGLDIVKKLCKQLNIEINLKSSPEGTTFELTLR
jgi:two-component system OmpR family sensor kinase